MKNRSFFIALAGALSLTVLVSAYSLAGSPEDREAKAAERIDKLIDYLELDPAQEAEVRDIFAAAKSERESYFDAIEDSGDKPDRGQVRAWIREHRNEIEAQIQSVLTEEQWQTFQERPFRKHRHKRRHGHDDDDRA